MKLEIKEPCHEDWEKMKIGLISRHCAVCDKGVMDFTEMNRAEITTYILSNPNDQVCGRMNRDQFDFHHEDIPILIEELKKQKVPNPFLILALVCLSLSSCAQEETGNPPPVEQVQGNVSHNPPDTISQNQIQDSTQHLMPLKGDIKCEPIELGEIEPVEIIEMGDIEAPVSGGIGLVDLPHSAGGNERVYQFANQMPSFKGGVDALDKFVKLNLKYPEYEKKQGIQGNVYVRFVVESDGSITRPEIMQSVPGSHTMDAEVLRIIHSMPKWNPGQNQGKKVPVYMSIPIRFSLK